MVTYHIGIVGEDTWDLLFDDKSSICDSYLSSWYSWKG